MTLPRFDMLPPIFFLGVFTTVASGVVAIIVVAIIVIRHRRQR